MDLQKLSESLLSSTARRSWRGIMSFLQGGPPVAWAVDAGLPDVSTVPLADPRRRRLLELAEEYEFIVLEDNVYGELRYDGETLPTLMSLDTTGLVVKVDSVSKTLAPALRMGWVTGAQPWISAMAGVRGDLGV